MAGIELKCGHYSLNVSSTAVPKKQKNKQNLDLFLLPHPKKICKILVMSEETNQISQDVCC